MVYIDGLLNSFSLTLMIIFYLLRKLQGIKEDKEQWKNIEPILKEQFIVFKVN